MAAEASAQPLSEIVSQVVGGSMASKLSRNQLAAHAWFSANGDLERSHTCGVYLRQARGGRADPVLGVYVDTPSRVTDFRANKELYLSRLSNVGYMVSDIDFRLSRGGRVPSAAVKGPTRTDGRRSFTPDLPELSPEGMRRVETLTKDLPEGLRQSAARAMSASLRREKLRQMKSST